MRVLRRAWPLFVAVMACGDPGAFVCADDESCSGGVCQPSGYCSFDDPQCASGQRYGAHAPADLARACVELDAGETIGETSATTTEPSTSLTTSTASTTTEPSSDPSDSATTPTTIGESSVTTDPTDETTVGVEDSSSSGGPAPTILCRDEEFADEMLDDWVVVQDAPTDAFVEEDWLIIDLAAMPSSAGLDPIAPGIQYASIQTLMVEAPNQVLGTQVYLGFGVETASYLLLLEDDTLIVRHDMGDMGFEDLSESPWTGDEMWWRIEIVDGDLAFLESEDGRAWDTLETVTPEFAIEDAEPYLRAGTWVGTPSPPGYAIFERVSLCTFE